MDTVSANIAKIIDESYNGNKSAFARDIGITPGYAAQLYSGQREPSDRTIADICRVCGANEVWLRTGAGKPYADRTRSEELAEIFEQVEIGDNEKAKLIRAMARMPDEAFPAFVKFLEGLHKMLGEE